jgi:hypothetical protein
MWSKPAQSVLIIVGKLKLSLCMHEDMRGSEGYTYCYIHSILRAVWGGPFTHRPIHPWHALDRRLGRPWTNI